MCIKSGIILLVLINFLLVSSKEICDRRPLGSKTEPLTPDNTFAIEVLDLKDGNKYVPLNNYTVRLYSRDERTHFIAFMLWIAGDTKPNLKNNRRPDLLQPGHLIPNDMRSRINTYCDNTIQEKDINPKNSVEAIWQAPPKENKCVTIYAVVALKKDVWYNYGGPLQLVICEETLNLDDMQPKENYDCQVCEDARYKLTFEGTWSFNTHGKMFPQTKDGARFSDVVGASHSNEFTLFKLNSEATEGLKMLAEQGNTTALEIEIRKELGNSVRTILKATGPPEPNMSTSTMFRVNRNHHWVSIVASLLPSPDWFLGVSNMELCDIGTQQWAPSAVLNLYPLDAGTDSGRYFDSSKDETSPAQPIASANINQRGIPVKRFAKLKFELIRTYPTQGCQDITTTSETNDGIDNWGTDDKGVTEEAIPTSPKLEVDPTASPNCPITEWEEWLPCEAQCIDNKISGLKTRFRYHVVNGVPVKAGDVSSYKKIPEYCRLNLSELETTDCEEECSETSTPELEEEPSPGHGWNENV